MMTDEPLRVDAETPDLAAEKLAQLQELFPGAFADGVVDAARIGELVGMPVAGLKDGRERYGLMWAGKQEAVASLLKPSRGTLVPDMERSIDFENARNVFIEGDNLEVLKILQKSYNDQVKLIYIDPPYNTTNDFVYNDDFTDGLRAYLEYTGQLDAEGKRTSANSETSGRRHSSWLSMMYPRLALARNLLTQDGAIFISIDDNELAQLRMLLDEVFGAENFVTILNWKKRGTGGQHAKNAIIDQVEYIVVYARDATQVRLSGLPSARAGAEKWRDLRKGGGQWQRRYRPKQFYPIWASSDGSVSLDESDERFAILPADRKGEEGFWENGIPTVAKRIAAGEIRAREVNGKWKIEQLEIAKETTSAGNFIDIPSTRGVERLKSLLGAPVFENPKPIDLLNFVLDVGCLTDGDIVMDLFAGSGSTGDAVLNWGAARGVDAQFVLVNLPEEVRVGSEAQMAGYSTVSEIALARLRVALPATILTSEAGLRVFRLSESLFEAPPAADETMIQLSANTLPPDVDLEPVAYEVWLREGVMLSDNLQETENAPKARRSGSVAVVLDLELTQHSVDAAIESNPRVLVFLEDAFAGKDALKASAFYACKQAGVTMKTV